tara:strand:- start:14 stop:616 length:603 start_codon:yes stop_codon:yes gene_type:complete
MGCPSESISGCMDSTACNYNPDATEDDGSCNLPDGCTDNVACNYNQLAICDDNSCLYEIDALPNPIEIVFIEENVSGYVGEDIISHIHIRNASCSVMEGLVVRKFFTSDSIVNNNQTPDDISDDFNEAIASSYFCFNGICFPSSTILSPVPMSLNPFEEDDYFKSYLNASIPGQYEVTYRFYLEDNPIQFKEVEIIYEVN